MAHIVNDKIMQLSLHKNGRPNAKYITKKVLSVINTNFQHL